MAPATRRRTSSPARTTPGTNTGGASFASELAPLGVVFVQADRRRTASSAPARRSTTSTRGSPTTTTTSRRRLDPGNANLGVFFDAAAVPFNMNIDARSMEILSTDVGFDTEMDNTIKTRVLPHREQPATRQAVSANVSVRCERDRPCDDRARFACGDVKSASDVGNSGTGFHRARHRRQHVSLERSHRQGSRADRFLGDVVSAVSRGDAAPRKDAGRVQVEGVPRRRGVDGRSRVDLATCPRSRSAIK